MHACERNKNNINKAGLKEANQSVELIRITRDGDLGRTDSQGGFYVAAIRDMLGTKVNRHGHPRYEHVDHVTNHAANNKRINGGRHGWK